MEIKKVDARGLPCPQPVIKTKQALEALKTGTVEVTVDNQLASENVSRFAGNSGCEASIQETGKDFVVTINKPPASMVSREEITCPASLGPPKARVAVLIKSDVIGIEEDSIGVVLMQNFLSIVRELNPRPAILIFMNSGVKLTVEGYPKLEELKQLEKEGTDILVCGYCLDYFKKKEKLKVGRISNFLEIAQVLMQADKVISM